MSQPATAEGKGWQRHGSATFVFTDEAHGIVMRLKNARVDDGYTYADVHAYFDHDTQSRPVFLLTRPRVNLTSDRSLPGLIKSLAARHGYDWASFMEKVCAVLVSQMDEHGVVTMMEPLEDDDLEQPMLFRRFVPRDLVSGLVANGGVGKSMIGAMMALAVATGKPIGPFEPLTSGPVLYLDWENNGRKMHQRRMTRLCRGLGMPFPQNIVHYEARGKLSSAEGELVELGHDHGAVLSILDSIGFAAGGNLNDSDIAITAVNTLKHLPGTKVMMAHVSKSTMNTATGATGPTGSAFFWNGPQAVYELRATEAELDNSLTLGVFHAKANVGPKLKRPLGVRLEFVDPSGPITPSVTEIRGDDIGGEALPLKTRVLDALDSLGGQASAGEIAERLRMSEKGGHEQVTGALRALKDSGGVSFIPPEVNGKRNGAVALWSLAGGDNQSSGTGGQSSDEPPFLCRCGAPGTAFTDTGVGVCDGHLR